MKKVSDRSSFLSRYQAKTLAFLGVFLGGLVMGSVGLLVMQSHFSSLLPRPLRQSDISTAISEYTFIDPLVATDGMLASSRYAAMQQQVASYINAQHDQGLVTATVYFRDINEQGGFVINPDEKYTPASLYKVPVMMVYYKIAERDPSILSDVVVYIGADDANKVEDIKSVVQLIPGHSYTVEELIEHMIRYSDNNAVNLLTAHLNDTNHLNDYDTVFADLGIDPASLMKYSDTMTAEQYTIFLRSLYNATYLDRSYSEQALKLMSETDFTEGLEAGVPNGILVSQKFGEVRMTDSSGNLLGKQLNNCGIVYYPKHPYLLCVLTKATGDNVKGLETTVSSLSRIVYKGMQNLYP